MMVVHIIKVNVYHLHIALVQFMAMVYQLSAVQEEIIRKGPWLEEEDERLATFATHMGERRWDSIAKVSGLRRSGKSCRLRWMNYLRPDLKHGQMNAEEERIILKLQHRWGNKWSKIARKLPGRTDNEIKNYWRTHLRKKTQIEEQEKEKAANDAPPADLLAQRDVVQSEKRTWIEHDGCAQDIMKPSEHSLDVSGLSPQNVLVYSPYENHIFDWISSEESVSFNDNNVLKHNGQCSISSSDSWFNIAADTSILDFTSISLWESEKI